MGGRHSLQAYTTIGSRAGAFFGALVLCACGGETEFAEAPVEVKHEMPELYTSMLEGIGAMKQMRGELAIAVDLKGAMAALSGAGHSRTLNVVDTLGEVQTSQLRLAPDGMKAGPVSMLMHDRRVLLLTQHDRKLQRYGFDGKRDGGAVVLRDVVRLIGITRDSIDVLLGERMSQGGVRFAGVGRMAMRGGRARMLLAASQLPLGQLVAPSDSAAERLFPMVAVDGSTVVIMDLRDGVMRSFGPQGAPPRSFGPIGGSSTAWSDARSVLGIFFDSSHRLWRFTSDETRIIADVFAEGETLGVSTRPCHRAQAAAVQGEFAAILCSDRGQVEIFATPTVFNISG